MKPILRFLIQATVIASLLVISGPSRAAGPVGAVPTSEPSRSVYLRLMEDLYDEVMSMDAVTEPLNERQQFVNEMKNAISNPSQPNPAKISGHSWSGIWPPAAAPAPLDTTSNAEFHHREPIRIPGQNHAGLHALADRMTYVERRLGAAAAVEIHQHHVDVLVYGGTATSALGSVDMRGRSAIRIPSLYSAWGITKFLVTPPKNSDQKPLLIYVIPPSREYLKHYAYMLDYLNASSTILLDTTDQFSEIKRARQAVDRIAARAAKGHPDFVVLGYYDQWLEASRRADSPYEFAKSSAIIKGAVGLEGRAVDLVDRRTGQTEKVLILKSRKAIWGESSAFIAEAATWLKPKGILFFGSAGAVSPDVRIYSVSVPSKFQTSDGPVETSNFLNLAEGNSATWSNVARFGGIHGNTNSPMEQGFDYLRDLQDEGVATLDVEQSLIARVIAQHNSSFGTDIKFGAANVITDHPGSILGSSSAEFDLDRVDRTVKGHRRQQAVLLAMSAMDKMSSANAEPSPGSALTCEGLFR